MRTSLTLAPSAPSLTPVGCQNGPDLLVVTLPAVRVRLAEHPFAGHTEPLGHRDAASVGGGGDPFDPVHAPDVDGPVDQCPGRPGDQAAALRRGLQPAADLAVAVPRLEHAEEDTADQGAVQPDAVETSGVGR